MAKYNNQGFLIWKKTIKDYGKQLVVDRDSNIYMAGITERSEDAEVWVAKYNPQGFLVWQRTMKGYMPITIDDAGNIYRRESIPTSDGQNTDNWVTKYNSSGYLIWKYKQTLETYENIKVDKNGNIYTIEYADSLYQEEQQGSKRRVIWLNKYSQK